MNFRTTTPFGLTSNDLIQRVNKYHKTKGYLYKYVVMDSLSDFKQLEELIQRDKNISSILLEKKFNSTKKRYNIDNRLLAIIEFENNKNLSVEFGTTNVMNVNSIGYKKNKEIFDFFLNKILTQLH